jgi:hypothetical protein
VFAAMDKSSGSTYPVCICNDCMDQTQKHKWCDSYKSNMKT